MQLARQRAGQVKAEAVDVHFCEPIAQAVHDQLQHTRIAHIERVATPSVVHIIALVLRGQAVVGRVVDTSERDRRPHLIPLGRMVVDHVQDDFDLRIMQISNHRFELAHDLVRCVGGGIARIRCEEAYRVVSPIVHQTLLLQVAVVAVQLHWEQFNCVDPELSQILHRLARSQAGIRTSMLLANRLVQLAETLDVRLIYNQLMRGNSWRSIISPGECLVDNQPQRCIGGVVLRTK